tara:strand:+ start:45255 stop:45395 length:141 start_codon:yes stop_codon:yes gene_type:complete
MFGPGILLSGARLAAGEIRCDLHHSGMNQQIKRQHRNAALEQDLVV